MSSASTPQMRAERRRCRAAPPDRDGRATPASRDRAGRAPATAAPGIRARSRAPTPVGIEALHDRQHRFDSVLARRRAASARSRADRRADSRLRRSRRSAPRAIRRCCRHQSRDGELRQQMILAALRLARSVRSRTVVIAIEAPCRAHARPVRRAGGLRGASRRTSSSA